MTVNWFEKIEEYLNGEMTREELSLFQAQMSKDEELSSAVNMYRVINAEMSQHEQCDDAEISLRKTLKELSSRYIKRETNEELPAVEKQIATVSPPEEIPFIGRTKADMTDESRVKIKKGVWIRLTVAAGIIGIVTLSVTWYFHKADYSNVSITKKIPDTSKNANNKDASFLPDNMSKNDLGKKDEKRIITDKDKNRQEMAEVQPATLFANYFKPDAVPADKEGPLEDAFAYYESKKYADAISAIENADLNIITRGEEPDQELTAFYARYYKGLCYLANKNIQKAVPELDSARTHSPGQVFKIKAQWYLALAYLKDDRLKKAKQFLKYVAHNNQETEYKLKAQKLLRELKR